MPNAKPHPNFPLTPRGDGRWCKKIKGQFHYFTGTADEALKEWNRVKDDLLAGEERRPAANVVTVADLVNRFLTFKKGRLVQGRLSQRTFERYENTGKMLAKSFGRNRPLARLSPDNFEKLAVEMGMRFGLVALANEIQIVRCIFGYGVEARLLPEPMRFGPGFQKPTAKELRIKRAKSGQRDLSSQQIRDLLDVATPRMKAMILLAINGGLGNTDLGELTLDRFDFAGGWLDYPRPKTGSDRRIPLWPETMKAIKAITKNLSAGAQAVFVSPTGQDYVGVRRGQRVADDFKRAARNAGVEGRGFYDLRRTFQTQAENAHDLAATQKIMGHAPSTNDMSARYRQHVSDDRLRAVTDSVRRWLFPPVKKTTGKKPKAR